MGQGQSKGLEGIADHAFGNVASANLSFTHEDLTTRGFQKIYDILREGKWLPQIVEKTEKSNESSQKLRTEANEKYVRFGANESMLKLYTKAICAAHSDSKEIALAYASRSAVTYDLKEYEDSIRDINHALAAGYPLPKFKLYVRRGRCHLALSQYSRAHEDFIQAKQCMGDSADKKQIRTICTLMARCRNEQDISREPLPNAIKLSHPPSSNIQSASAAVDIKYSREFGRYVVAVVDIKPGDVLTIEKAYASVLKPEVTGNFYCDYCKVKSFSTVPCLSCTNVVFCSNECRQSSWQAYHTVECSILPTLIGLSHSNKIEGGVEMKTFTAVRILNVASGCGKEIEKLVTMNSKPTSPESAGFVDGKYLSDFNAVNHLVTNLESHSREKLTGLAVYAVCLMHMLKEGTEFFGKTETSPEHSEKLSSKNVAAADLLFKYLMMVHINSLSIGDLQHRSIAGGIFPFHSLFNHSCDPNVTHFTVKGDSMFTVAIQPIEKGQIFEDYGYNYNAEPIAERQFWLKNHYSFTCRCIACENDWPPYQFLPVSPIVKRADAERSIMDYVRRFTDIRRRIVFEGAGTDKDIEFISRFMILASKVVKLPLRIYVDCQDTIKCYMAQKAQPQQLELRMCH